MKKDKSFQEKMSDLDEILAWFESDEVNLEQSVTKYEQALALSKELQDELKNAQNKIETLNKKFSA